MAKHKQYRRSTRRARIEWEVDYFFVKNDEGNLQCIICDRIITTPKHYNVSRHYSRIHGKEYNGYSMEARLHLVTEYKKKRMAKNVKEEPSTASSTLMEFMDVNSASLMASCSVALKLAKANKSFDDGPFIKECAIDMLKTFGNNIAINQLETVSLTKSTLEQKITEIDDNIQSKVQDILQSSHYFSLGLDQVHNANSNQLLMFLRIVQFNFQVNEELLCLENIEDTGDINHIFQQIKTQIDKYGGFEKCSCIITNGSDVMVDQKHGLINILRENNVICPVFHSIIHLEHLFKDPNLTSAMKTVVDIVNLIRERDYEGLNLKLASFLNEFNLIYADIPKETPIQWIDSGNCLRTFFSVRQELIEFLQEEDVKNYVDSYIKDLSSLDFLRNLAFLTDITIHLNEFTSKLQNDNQTIEDLYRHVNSFRNRLKLLDSQLQKNNFSRLSCCLEVKEQFSVATFTNFRSFIENLMKELNKRFSSFDNTDMKSDITLFINPKIVKPEEQKYEFQLELCELQADLSLLSVEEVGVDFYKLLPIERYPNLRDFGLHIFSMFASTAICQNTYSTYKRVVSDKSNSLEPEILLATLRVAASEIPVDIFSLVDQFMQS